jgi:5-methyltetrahydropteroyltriglutamate--homocysteine methyltransferase
MKTYAYGYPRLGSNREYKKTIESFWQKKSDENKLKEEILNLEKNIISIYEKSVDYYPVGEMTFYDNMLDTAIMLGVYDPKNKNQYFDLTRGKNALTMKKWFNTNYHYLVPDFSNFNINDLKLNWNKPKEAKNKYTKGLSYLIGPFTFLKLSKNIETKKFNDYLFKITEIYKQIIKDLDTVHIDEPCFVMDLEKKEIDAIKNIYNALGKVNSKIHLFTYYDSVDFFKELYELPVMALGLDFVHSPEPYKNIKEFGFPSDKTLIAGVVDGRNIWKTDILKTRNLLKELSTKAKSMIISNACPLYHLPVSIEFEKNLDKALYERLSFALERLEELKHIAQFFDNDLYYGNHGYSKENLSITPNESVKKRVENLCDADFVRAQSYQERCILQKKALDLPLLPTTTIGSFPQTDDVRQKRAELKSNKITGLEYDNFIKRKISETISMQNELGLDVFVHGEFERSDMVEFFAEKLDGVATSQNGWIISYGTRCYRPPIIYSDVSRPLAMTLNEISYAQSLTKKPVKGMLTGPTTIIAWSFVRDDIPINDVAYQIAFSLYDEIKDYENAGIKIVQIDEPAIREKAPIKKRNWNTYFDWAIKAFNLACSAANPQTQIHTHMCYSEFGEIIDKINALDFDVILIEATRSKGDIIKNFESINFVKQIGLGVWDIHSPVVPSIQDMEKIIARASKTLHKENFWINPDCGLKTRQWPETMSALKNLIQLAQNLRTNKS